MINLRIALFFILFYTTFIYSQDYNFNISEIPSSLKKDANSVIRFENISIEIESQKKMIISCETAVTVYNKLADNLADITIHYDKRRKINSVKAYIYDVNGDEIKKVKKNEFRDYSAYDGISLYNDGRLIHYDHTTVSYPYTIYYTYEIETSNTAFIPRWILNNRFYQSVESAEFTLKYPLTIKLFKSEKNFKNFDIIKTETPGLISYKINNIEALKKEPYVPELLEFLPTVKFGIDKFNLEGVNGIASNWTEFGKWYYDNLIQNTLSLPEETKRKIKDLTSSTSDPIEKAKIVYKYVQSKVRYISVQVGIGGYKPMLASDVDKLGYGDCKALTNYTSALLKEVGIPSYHTLIHAGEKINFNKDVASPEGNHMILYVPINDQDFWLECTSQTKPFAEIGSFTDNRDVLIITPEGGVIKHTKIYKTEENLQFTKGEFKINELGDIQAKVRIEATGTQYDDHLFRYDGENQKELDLLVKKYFSNINNMNISKIEVNNNKEEAMYEEDLEFSAANYGVLTNQQMLISINAFNKNTSIPKRVRDRKLPVEISRGFLDIDEVVIKLPTNFKVEYLPENVELKSKFGTYSTVINKIDSNTYLYKRKLQITEGKYEKEDYELYRSFRKKIKKHDNSKIVLIK